MIGGGFLHRYWHDGLPRFQYLEARHEAEHAARGYRRWFAPIEDEL